MSIPQSSSHDAGEGLKGFYNGFTAHLAPRGLLAATANCKGPAATAASGSSARGRQQQQHQGQMQGVSSNSSARVKCKGPAATHQHHGQSTTHDKACFTLVAPACSSLHRCCSACTLTAKQEQESQDNSAALHQSTLLAHSQDGKLHSACGTHHQSAIPGYRTWTALLHTAPYQANPARWEATQVYHIDTSAMRGSGTSGTGGSCTAASSLMK